MTWSHYIQSLYTDHWWQQAEAQWIISKRAGKALAKRLGIPCACELEMPEGYVMKPDRGWGSRDVRIVPDSSQWVVEELVADMDGTSPPRDWSWYVFQRQSAIVQVSRSGGDALLPVESAYYLISTGSPDTWEQIKPNRRELPELPLDAPEEVLATMRTYAERIAGEFTHLRAPRVDLYYSPRGVLFGELCATPGLVMGKLITPEWDERLGRLIV